MKIITNIVTSLLLLTIPAFFVLISFNFADPLTASTVSTQKSDIIPYTVQLKKTPNGKQSIEKNKKTFAQAQSDIALGPSQAGFIEFGRLATAFFLQNSSGTLSFRDMNLSGTVLTIDPQYATIVSMYDLFTTYTIRSLNWDFSISQITNGSLYIWMENDGTYSLYSIDSVVRLDFLDAWNTMTDMVLFPGMYIRFDPKMNKALEWANLFRVLQSLEPNGTDDISLDSTGIEFVNPRMNTTNDKDSFLMYRLPTKSRLFEMLHVLFYERVSQIDIYKEYGSIIWAYSDETSASERLINPWKRSHLLLLKLDSVLANTLKNPTSIDVFKKNIADIRGMATWLWLWNAVDARLEGFLTDSRFALFSWTKNAELQAIYQAASEAIEKAPSTPHAKLLQKLSDIYSINLATQKKDLAFSNIDTYTPTATELSQTLQSTDIEQRNYFDIALYAFNVLKKMEDNSIFTTESINARPMYSLIQTVITSTERYVKNITDTEKKQITYEWIALHFYLNLFTSLTQSLYSNFMVAEDGKLFLSSSLRPTQNDEKIRIDDALKRDMLDLDIMLSVVSERMDEYYWDQSTHHTYKTIKKHIAFYRWFADILDYDAYKEYEKTPYLLDTSEIHILPQYQDWAIVRYDPNQNTISPEWVQKNNLDQIQSFFWGRAQSSTIEESLTGYTIKNTNIALTWRDGVGFSIDLDVVVDKTTFQMGNITVIYGGKSIPFLTPQSVPISSIEGILSAIPLYIARMDTLLAWNSAISGDVSFIDTTKKIIIGKYIFPLVP